jgi:cytochrome c oxidase subunit II
MEQRVREERKNVQRRRRRMRATTFAVIGALVLGAAGYLLFEAFWKPELPLMAGNVIDIAADMGGFSRKEVRVKAGEPVTVRLRSLDNSHHTDGGGKHQWAVDELGVNIIAPPLGSNYKTFTPAKPGTYTFYCDICCGGRANPTMSGRLVVVG